MDIKILNKDRKWEASIDHYKSFIWTERYSKCGDFEIYLPMENGLLDIFKLDDYVSIDDSDRIMVIENLKTVTDPDSGDMLIVSGRSSESLMDRRIILEIPSFYNSNIDAVLGSHFVHSFNNPNILGVIRVVPFFIYVNSTDSRILNMLVYGDSSMKNLYSLFEDLTNEKDIGFKTILNDERNFETSLYIGEDRSYGQTKNPTVIFSDEFGNLRGSTFLKSNQDYKNFYYVYNSVAGIAATTPVVDYPKEGGLNFRELYIDASGEAGQTSVDALNAIGRMQLGRHKIKNDFSGEGDNTPEYAYKKDYFLGDIVELEDKYGNYGKARITEYIFCDDEQNGIQRYPTFSAIS